MALRMKLFTMLRLKPGLRADSAHCRAPRALCCPQNRPFCPHGLVTVLAFYSSLFAGCVPSHCTSRSLSVAATLARPVDASCPWAAVPTS